MHSPPRIGALIALLAQKNINAKPYRLHAIYRQTCLFWLLTPLAVKNPTGGNGTLPSEVSRHQSNGLGLRLGSLYVRPTVLLINLISRPTAAILNYSVDGSFETFVLRYRGNSIAGNNRPTLRQCLGQGTNSASNRLFAFGRRAGPFDQCDTRSRSATLGPWRAMPPAFRLFPARRPKDRSIRLVASAFLQDRADAPGTRRISPPRGTRHEPCEFAQRPRGQCQPDARDRRPGQRTPIRRNSICFTP